MTPIALSVPSTPEKISETAPVSERTSLQTRMDSLMWLRGVCLANLRALSGSGVVLQMTVGCGPKPCELLESYNPDTQSWKTQEPSCLWKEEEHSVESSGALPTSGMMCNGMLYQLPRLVQDIAGKDSGFWLPTPIARDWKDTPGMAKQAGDRKR